MNHVTGVNLMSINDSMLQLKQNDSIGTAKTCSYCKGKGRVPTDMWSDSNVMWHPCLLCSKEERLRFYRATEQQQLEWYKDAS